MTKSKKATSSKLFSKGMVRFYKSLKDEISLPNTIEWIHPFKSKLVLDISKQYHDKFYADTNARFFLFGINPGRFGAGVTGIPFTDPIYLENVCGIKNDLHKRHELSAIYIHDMIKAYGGIKKFTSNFYISSMCPLGFIKDGKNINYYDDKKLEKVVTPYILDAINKQIKIGAKTEVAFSLGKGKNYKYFQKINQEYQFFKEVIPLPHPRWVMQYRRKDKELHIEKTIGELTRFL